MWWNVCLGLFVLMLDWTVLELAQKFLGCLSGTWWPCHCKVLALHFWIAGHKRIDIVFLKNVYINHSSIQSQNKLYAEQRPVRVFRPMGHIRSLAVFNFRADLNGLVRVLDSSLLALPLYGLHLLPLSGLASQKRHYLFSFYF